MHTSIMVSIKNQTDQFCNCDLFNSLHLFSKPSSYEIISLYSNISYDEMLLQKMTETDNIFRNIHIEEIDCPVNHKMIYELNGDNWIVSNAPIIFLHGKNWGGECFSQHLVYVSYNREIKQPTIALISGTFTLGQNCILSMEIPPNSKYQIRLSQN